eukprot:COSAG02_NODE_10594_length_1904_cov_2.221053_1_plen_225_part_10
MYGSCCTGSVERLVEGSECWEACAPLSTPRRLHGAAALANKLYVFGGSPGNGAVDAKVKTDSVECYLPETDRWEARAPLPRPMNVSAAAVGAFIYVLPYGDEPMWRYDPTQDCYECMGPLPLKNFHCFAVTAGSAAGGTLRSTLRPSIAFSLPLNMVLRLTREMRGRALCKLRCVFLCSLTRFVSRFQAKVPCRQSCMFSGERLMESIRTLAGGTHHHLPPTTTP